MRISSSILRILPEQRIHHFPRRTFCACASHSCPAAQRQRIVVRKLTYSVDRHSPPRLAAACCMSASVRRFVDFSPGATASFGRRIQWPSAMLLMSTPAIWEQSGCVMVRDVSCRKSTYPRLSRRRLARDDGPLGLAIRSAVGRAARAVRQAQERAQTLRALGEEGRMGAYFCRTHRRSEERVCDARCRSYQR